MAASEKRTLDILAKVTDLASRPLTVIGQKFKSAFAGGVKDAAAMAKQLFSVKTAVAALAGGFAAFRGGQAIAGIVQSTDELGKLARGTGSSAQRLLVLQNAFKLSNIEGERFRALLAALTKSVGQALTDGGSKAAKQLGKLGLTLEDLRTHDPVQLFDRLAASLERFSTPQEKAAALIEVFPKMSGQIELMIDVLGQGQEAFRNLVATAEYFGGTLTNDQFDAIVKLNGAFDLMSVAIDRVGRSATAAIAQKLGPIIERLAVFVATNGDRIGEAIGKIVAVLADLVLRLSAALLRLVALLSSNGERIIETLEDMWIVGAPIAKLLRGIFDAREIAPGARAIRDEMEATADELSSLETKAREGKQWLAEMAKLPGEFGQQRIDAQRQLLASLDKQRQELQRKLHDMEQQFNQAQASGGGAPQSDESGRQQRAAELRQMASELGNLLSFDSLPIPPTSLSPLLKVLYGAGGEEEAKKKVRSFTDGFKDELDGITKKWGDFGAAGQEAAAGLIDGGLNGLVDAFADIATAQKTFKEAFRDLARMMLGELAKIVAKLVIMKTLQAFGLPSTGYEFGGVATGNVQRTAPVRKFAMGGVVRQPTVAIFGEGSASKGEAFVPLPDGRRIPVALQGHGGGSLNITIQAMDGADVQRVLLKNRGTLRAVWQQDVARVRAVRQNVAGAAR